jgi:hypothetical protein
MLQLTNSVAEDTFESVEAAANVAGHSMRRFAWISDKTKDERQRLRTILPKLWCLDGDDLQISLIDTPGHRSCSLMCIASMCMADAALVVVSANRGNFEEGIAVEGSDARSLCGYNAHHIVLCRRHPHAAAGRIRAGHQKHCCSGEPVGRCKLQLWRTSFSGNRGKNEDAFAQGMYN